MPARVSRVEEATEHHLRRLLFPARAALRSAPGCALPDLPPGEHRRARAASPGAARPAAACARARGCGGRRALLSARRPRARGAEPMRECPLPDAPGCSLAARSLAACIAAILEVPPGDVPCPVAHEPLEAVGSYLATRNLGLVPVADAESFQWADWWLARMAGAGGRAAEPYVVMAGTPSGLVWAPAGTGAPAGAPVREGWVLAQPRAARARAGRPRGRRRRGPVSRERVRRRDGVARPGHPDRRQRARGRPLCEPGAGRFSAAAAVRSGAHADRGRGDRGAAAGARGHARPRRRAAQCRHSRRST